MSLDWLYYILLVMVLIAGLFINILGLPGLWVMIAGAAGYAWITRWDFIAWKGLIALVVLALLAELAEFVAGAAGSKAAGGSKRGMAGAIIGGVVGGILGTPIPVPVVATILGACVGAFVGAFLVEYSIGRNSADSATIGIGAAKGRLIGILVKLGFGVVMLIVALWTALPIGGRPAVAGPAALPATAPSAATTNAVTTNPALSVPLEVERPSTQPGAAE